jgi:hypothetical protein
MTDGDMKRLLDYVAFVPIPVTVKANDYAYDGWLIGGGEKRHGEFRVMVEDSFGRIYIHNCGQVRVRDEAEPRSREIVMRDVIALLPNDREAGLAVLDLARRMVERFKR